MGHHFYGKRVKPDEINFLIWLKSDCEVETDLQAFLKAHSASGMFNMDCGWSTIFVHCDEAETVMAAIRERWGTTPGFRIEVQDLNDEG